MSDVHRQPHDDGRLYDCAIHGWSALGTPCPRCKVGEAPRRCYKHAWWHSTKGCPDCQEGRP